MAKEMNNCVLVLLWVSVLVNNIEDLMFSIIV